MHPATQFQHNFMDEAFWFVASICALMGRYVFCPTRKDKNRPPFLFRNAAVISDDGKIEATDRPWVFAVRCRTLKKDIMLPSQCNAQT